MAREEKAVSDYLAALQVEQANRKAAWIGHLECQEAERKKARESTWYFRGIVSHEISGLRSLFINEINYFRRFSNYFYGGIIIKIT